MKMNEGFREDYDSNIRSRAKHLNRKGFNDVLQKFDKKSFGELAGIKYQGHLYPFSRYKDLDYSIEIRIPINDNPSSDVLAYCRLFDDDFDMIESYDISQLDEIVNRVTKELYDEGAYGFKKRHIDTLSDNFDEIRKSFVKRLNSIKSENGREKVFEILSFIKSSGLPRKLKRISNYSDARWEEGRRLSDDLKNIERDFVEEQPVKVGEQLYGSCGKTKRMRNFTVINVTPDRITITSDKDGDSYKIENSPKEDLGGGYSGVGAFAGENEFGKYRLWRSVLSDMDAAHFYANEPKKVKKYNKNIDKYLKGESMNKEQALKIIKEAGMKAVPSSQIEVNSDNLEEFFVDLNAALSKIGYDVEDYDEFEEELNDMGLAHLFNVASDDEYDEWEEDHGSSEGYSDHYFAIAEKYIRKIKRELSSKWTGFDLDSDEDDTMIWVELYVDGIGDEE